MSQIPTRTILELSGSAAERGAQMVAICPEQVPAVRAQIEATRAEAHSAEELAWMDQMWQVQKQHLPEVCGFIEGIAAAMAVPLAEYYRVHFRNPIAMMRRRPTVPEECSAFVWRGESGLILAKNRDNPLAMGPTQIWLSQKGPDLGARRIVSVSTFGLTAAASSGMNSDGLCLTDTAVSTFDLGPGVLRYYLMDAILMRCATVAEALELIAKLPHLGGGNLFLADAAGEGAIVELGHRRHAAERLSAPGQGPDWIMRTNHFLDPEMAADLCEKPGSARFQNSSKRYAFIKDQLSRLTEPSIAKAQGILSSHHLSDLHDPICRHEAEVQTFSGVIYQPRQGIMLQSTGTPCQGGWMMRGF